VKDTPPAIERKFRSMLMELPGAERLKKGCSMHATAQALAIANISHRRPGMHPAELKRLLFLHFYGSDFTPQKRKRIASVLSKNGRPSKALETGKATTRKPLDVTDSANVKFSGAGAVREKRERYGRKGKAKAKRPRPSSGRRVSDV
jgi:hypothetical protein